MYIFFIESDYTRPITVLVLLLRENKAFKIFLFKFSHHSMLIFDSCHYLHNRNKENSPSDTCALKNQQSTFGKIYYYSIAINLLFCDRCILNL